MKLLFVTRSLSGGGAERVTVLLANTQASHGHEVHIVTFGRSPQEYVVNDNVRVHRAPKSMIRAIWWLRNFATIVPFDCIVSLGSKYHYILLAGLFSKSSVILSERNYPPRFYSNRLTAAFVRFCYRNAAGVVFQTEEVRAMYSKETRAPSCVIPNPVLSGLPNWSGSSQKEEVVSLGRLEEQKNFSLLIRAFSAVVGRRPECRLTIYGEGSLENELLRLISALGLVDKVRILPFTNAIHEELARADLFVSTSVYEGMSNAMVEALAVGVPVVAVDSLGGAARAIVGDGARGILVPQDDVEALSKAIIQVVTSEPLSRMLSEAGQSVKTDFHEDRVSEQWTTFFRTVLDMASSPNRPS